MPLKIYSVYELKASRIGVAADKPPNFTLEYIADYELSSEDVCIGAAIETDDGLHLLIQRIITRPRRTKTDLAVIKAYDNARKTVVNGSPPSNLQITQSPNH